MNLLDVLPPLRPVHGTRECTLFAPSISGEGKLCASATMSSLASMYNPLMKESQVGPKIGSGPLRPSGE